jgi:hypothetical protein
VVNVGSELFTVVDPSSMQLAGQRAADRLSQCAWGAAVRAHGHGYPTGRQFPGRSRA